MTQRVQKPHHVCDESLKWRRRCDELQAELERLRAAIRANHELMVDSDSIVASERRLRAALEEILRVDDNSAR